MNKNKGLNLNLIKKSVKVLKSLVLGKIKSFHFDWDDNVLKMPTKIIYFLKNKGINSPQELRVSTSFFAETRETVGNQDHSIKYSIKNGIAVVDENGSNSLNLADYEWIKENELSFREFRDHDTENFFLDHLKEALENKSFAPSYEDFVEALSCPVTAQRTTIITARGQSPETIYEAVAYMKEIGVIKHTIPLENIYPVSCIKLPAHLRSHSSDPSVAKKNVLKQMIDQLESQSTFASVGFSDDDKKTFDVMKEFFLDEKKQGKWPSVEISLFFTGNKKREKHII